MKWYELPEVQWPNRERGKAPEKLADIFKDGPPAMDKHEYMQLANGLWHCACGCGMTKTPEEFYKGITVSDGKIIIEKGTE